MKKCICLLLCAALTFSLACPAYAAETLTRETAGARLQELGVYQGSDSGDLMLGKGLTRAEMATILARLDDPKGEFAAHPQGFAYMCSFTDVPDWAKSPVGYSWNRGLVKGYSNGLYGATDMVTPDAACTVILRLYGHKTSEGTSWEYNTASAYAVSLELLPENAVQGAAISRGDMAVLICNAMGGVEAPKPAVPTNPTTDYAREANSVIFQGVLTRELYNGLRDMILHEDEVLAGAYQPMALGEVSRNGQAYQAMTSFSLRPIYDYETGADGLGHGTLRLVELYEPAVEHTKGFVESIQKLSQREQVTQIAWYVADRITYTVAYPGPDKVLTQDGAVPGCCMAYAYSFMYLCNLVDIPCILVQNDIHQWNKVYVDGQWWDVDVTGDDTGDEIQLRYIITVLHPPGDMQGSVYIDASPAVTAFLMELLVPGSTK